MVVLAQRAISGGMALASGLILGFIFSAGALGLLITGSARRKIRLPHRVDDDNRLGPARKSAGVDVERIGIK
jgi:hypothetical protein